MCDEECQKFKEYYQLSLEVLRGEKERFRNLDDKATKYLTSVSILTGAGGFFLKWLMTSLFPPRSWLECLLLLVGGLSVAGVLVCWVTLIRVLKIQSTLEIPIHDEMQRLFENEPLGRLYMTLAVNIRDALYQNRAATAQKARLLLVAHNLMILLISLLMVLAGLLVVHQRSIAEKWYKTGKDGLVMITLIKEKPTPTLPLAGKSRDNVGTNHQIFEIRKRRHNRYHLVTCLESKAGHSVDFHIKLTAIF